ncbi:MAG: TonB-dependent receptor domain-containing protein [Candidatus Eisenbacteria bacterium]
MTGRIEGTAARGLWVKLALAWLLALFVASAAEAGTTGKLAGRVLDQAGAPVAGATVVILGEPLGAFSDSDGYFNILNIPAGTVNVNVSHVAYQTLTIRDVVISADETTRLDDIRMQSRTVALEEVVVKAERPVVDVHLTSSRSSVDREQIESLPVQELQDVVNLQAGVVEGHIRGGRIGEVQYQVDGVSVNNPFNNESTVKIDRSLLQEVQVISGVFDAEYGQAMSGVVNAVLRDGTDRFEWNAEAFTGGYVFPGRESARLTDDKIRPTGIQSYQLNLSGPLPVPKTVYIVSGRRALTDGFVRATRRFVPTDSSDFQNKVFRPTGDDKNLPLGYTREWSGVAKLTNRSIEGITLSYQALANWIEGRSANFYYRLNPDGLSKQKTKSIAHGLDVTQTLSERTYYTLSMRQNYLDYTDRVYDSAYDPRYDAAGQPRGDDAYELGAIVQGVEPTRYIQKTNSWLLKGSYVTQTRRDVMLKMGAEIEWPSVKFGTTEDLVWTGDTLSRFPRHVPKNRPILSAGYAQGQLEWNDLTLRTGLRLQYFDARSSIPSDLANPANSISGAPESHPKSTTVKFTAAPRLGIAYPITDRSGIHLAYGHFYQFPALGDIFSNADYSVLEGLQSGGISYGVLGNPDIKPEKTVQYEMGYRQAVTETLGADLSVFYKDIRDLLGVEFVSTYNAAEYARLTNIDFGYVVGVTLSLDQQWIGPFSATLDYTWQLAEGNSSDPRETATRASAGEDPRPRQIPLNWDQRHTLNITATLSEPNLYTASAVLRIGSGQPYTPVLEQAYGYGLEANSGRKPAGMTVDLRAERSFTFSNMDVGLFGRVFNLFDTRYWNGPVFGSTGSPYYSRFPEADKVQLADPTRFFAPRRIEIGLRLRPGSATP